MTANTQVPEPQQLVLTNDVYDSYVREVFLCYDKNANGVLDKAEVKKMFQSITDDTVKCDIQGAFVDPEAKLIKNEDRKVIQSWFGGKNISMNLLYSKSKEGCNPILAKQRVYMKSGIFAVFKSTTGTVFGGYTSRQFQARPTGYMTDPEAFLFSLTKEVKLEPRYASTGIRHWGDGMIIVWDDIKLRNNCSIEVDLG